MATAVRMSGTATSGPRARAAVGPSLLALGRWAHHPLQGAPLTAATLLALAVTSATLAGARARGADLMTLGASTNLHNLAVHPVEVLFVSIFWVATPWVFWPVAAVLLPVLGGAERGLGSGRTALLFLAGHVGATLLTVAGIAVGVGVGWLPASLTYAVDVGPSYGLAAVAAALVAAVATPRRRRVLAVALAVGLVGVVVVDRSFTDVGHLVAALIGFLIAGVVLPGRTITVGAPRTRRKPVG